MDLSLLKITDLEYRSEGNASICFSIKGTCMVLKLPKTDVSHCGTKDVSPKTQSDQILYLKHVMSKYFSGEYLCMDSHVVGPFEGTFIIELMNSIEKHRPNHRKVKSISPNKCLGIIVGFTEICCCVSLRQPPECRWAFHIFLGQMEDACALPRSSGPVVSVEIKTKFGAVSG